MPLPWSAQLLSLAGSFAGLAGSYLESLLPAAQARGLPVEQLLQQSGLDRARLQADARVPLFKAFDLLLRAERASGDPLIGLRMGLEVRPRSFQLLGYASLSSATLGDAVQRLLRFESLVWDIGSTRLQVDGEQASLVWASRHLPWLPRQAVEIALAGWIALGRRLSEGAAQPRLLQFRHRLAAPAEDYEALIGCPVQGSAPRNAVSFPRALLNLPLPEADPGLCGWMERQGRAFLRDDGLKANDIRAVLCQGLPHAEFELEDVAARLGLGPRQLKRRLADAGLTLAGLQDEVRHDLAQLYLRHSELTLLEIACLLGFSEQSSFTRAFRRWEGCAPSEFRGQP